MAYIPLLKSEDNRPNHSNLLKIGEQHFTWENNKYEECCVYRLVYLGTGAKISRNFLLPVPQQQASAQGHNNNKA